MPITEIETIEELERHLAAGKPLRDVVVQGLDLTRISDLLDAADLSGAVFLGSELAASTYALACANGAVIFRPPVDVPFAPFRNALYTPEELFAGFDPARPHTYNDTLDERVYRHFSAMKGDSILESLSCRLHDHAVTDALEEKIEGRKVVAIMGGHGMRRTETRYRDVALIAKSLTERGMLMTSGGGPGAMEATHLGAWFAHRNIADLDAALEMLSSTPGFEPREAWLSTAMEVTDRFPLRANASGRLPDSLGIPTWLYGHEPPTVFATDIAKYFANSVREEGLLAIATNGVVFSPGSAGTIQEIFQDAAQNHYRSYGNPAPMVFLGEDYWRVDKPVFPLLTQLAAGNDYAALIHITDDAEAAVAHILAFAAERELEGDAARS
ncbi:MAG: LOG family protein [Acidimicrobiia bacterium]